MNKKWLVVGGLWLAEAAVSAAFAEEPKAGGESGLRAKIAAKCQVTGEDVWYGHRRTKFLFQNRKAWVVEPSVAAKPDNPWTWTMQWSEAFVDRTGVPELLKRGFHHATIDLYDTRMSDEGVAIAAAYQQFLVEELGFAPKARLIGMSWGGFFSTRYAAAHPENVGKIYYDAPLLNFEKFGHPDPDRIAGWASSMPAEGWANDPRMPVNMAGKLAAAKIPVLLIYGRDDRVVPPQYNCELFAKRFQEAGGEIKVVPRNLWGHHPHGLDPDKTAAIVDFFDSPVRVGIIGCDTSHTLAFTEIMNVKHADFCRDYRVTAAYQWGSRDIVSATNRYPAYLAKLRKMNVEIMPSIAALLEKVDVVCLETNDGREHYAQAVEVFKSGKRVFIDKPIAHNYADAKRIYDAGKQYGAAYFSSSSLRFSSTNAEIAGGKYGKIVGCTYLAPSPIEEQGTHSRYTWYGIHGFEPIVAVMGTGADTVRTVAGKDADEITITWKDGRAASLRANMKNWSYGGFAIPEKGKSVVMSGYEGYECLLRQIVKFFDTGVVPVPNEETLEIFAIMDAAEKSRERGGEPVTLAR